MTSKFGCEVFVKMLFRQRSKTSGASRVGMMMLTRGKLSRLRGTSFSRCGSSACSARAGELHPLEMGIHGPFLERADLRLGVRLLRDAPGCFAPMIKDSAECGRRCAPASLSRSMNSKSCTPSKAESNRVWLASSRRTQSRWPTYMTPRKYSGDQSGLKKGSTNSPVASSSLSSSE